ELNENVYGASLDYTLPFNWKKESQSLKIGVQKQYKDRKVSARVLGYINNSSGSGDLLTQPQELLFSRDNIAADKFFIEDITNPDNTYTGSGDLNAGYIMLNTNFSTKLKVVWGLRIENYMEQLNSRTNAGPVNVNNDYFDLLPSANFTYSLTEKA